MKNASGIEDGSIRPVDFFHPGIIVEVTGNVLFPLPGRNDLIPGTDDIREVQIVDPARSVVRASPGHVQTAAHIDDSRLRMVFQIIRDLPQYVLFPHGTFESAKLVQGAALLLLELGKIIVQAVTDHRCIFVLIESRELLRAELSRVKRNDQCFLYASLFDMNFFHGASAKSKPR